MPRLQHVFFAAAAAASLTLGGCGSIERPNLAEGAAVEQPPDPLKYASSDRAAFLRWNDAWTAQRASLQLDGLTVLALSGGGANGAYGAGLLVGWTASGTRPQFDLVTGVSTGALIAPLAFLGAGWDGKLTAAYHDPELRRLTEGRLGALLRPSLYSSKPLAEIIARYVDEATLAAIAEQDDKGRRLVVATTDLDRQQAILWDMGAIARSASAPDDRGEALKLFRQVLLASASIPGVFPPTLIDRSGSGRRAELHVDGGVASPFFVIPEAMTFWTPEGRMRPKHFYVIVNGPLNPTFARTRGGFGSIMARAYDTLSRSEVRTQIATARSFAERSGAPVSIAWLPEDAASDPLNFHLDHLASLFELGRSQAVQSQAFRQAPVIAADTTLPH